MPLVVEDLGELVYGGLVAGTQRLDAKRIREGKIKDKDLVKKWSFYTYLVPGLVSTGAVAFNYMPRYSMWTERLAHGFIYGFPGFVWDLMDIYKTQTASDRIVNEADRVLAHAGPRRANAYQFNNVRLT